ncbi:hypothetical protein [Aromatoleum sp.]|uniref:hypothetical protein n=1 Tax=Aromatoleum sp. TaxID=2307007 RepID=UPI002FCA1E32
MRDLLHPVLLGLLVVVIGAIAHRGSRGAGKLAGRLAADDEDVGAKDAVGKDASEENAVRKGEAKEGAPENGGQISA